MIDIDLIDLDKILAIILISFLLAIIIKLLIFVFKKVLVPSVKIFWKLLVICVIFLSVFAFFVVIYFSRELIFDALDTPIQYSILAILAFIASIKYLNNKR